MASLSWWWLYPTVFFSSSIFSFLYINRSRVVPLRWPVVGMLPDLLVNLHRVYDAITDMLLSSGHTFMFKGPWLMGLDFLITCDPANAKHMYITSFSDYPRGDEFSEILDIGGNRIITADGEMWSKQRKTAAYHMNSHQFLSSVAEHSRVKVEREVLPLMERMAVLDCTLDLQDVMKRLTMDLTCILVLGRDPGCLVPDLPIVPFHKAVEDVGKVLFWRYRVPMVWWKLLRRLQLGEEKKLAAAMTIIDRFIAGCIEESRGESGSNSLLNSYVSQVQNTEESSDYFTTNNFVRDTALSLLAAGTDTTASALSWLFWLVTKSPNVENKILEELRGLGTELLLEDVQGLTYLHAAVCEALRLYPPIPFNQKVASKDDVLPSGHRVLRGTRVLLSAYSTGRMEKLWGEDCLEFKPERWIDSADGRLKHVHTHEFLAFHLGPRSCLGKNIALAQMKVVAAAMIYNFQLELQEECRVEPVISVVMGMKNGLMIKIRKREVSC